MPEDVYVIELAGRKLVYSPLRNVAALLNAPGATELAAMLANSDRQTKTNLPAFPLGELAGLLRGPAVAPQAPSGPVSPAFLGLVVTLDCNMACRYCDFDSTDAKDLSTKTALAAVDWWVQHQAAKQRNAEIHFFGGEPFIRPRLVEAVVHRARTSAASRGVQTRFAACTNGRMPIATADFLADHFDSIVLSLDGGRAEHDLHRVAAGGRSKFDDVWRTAERVCDSRVALSVRCCISAATVERMVSIAEWFAEKLGPAEIVFETLRPNSRSEAAGLAPPDPHAFAGGFVRASRAARRHGVRCVYASCPPEPRTAFCPAGLDALIVFPDASVRGCYLPAEQWRRRGLKMTLGSVSQTGLDIDSAAVEDLRCQSRSRRRCERCFCRWTCAGGCLVHETYPGHDLAYSDFCRQTRLIHAAALLDRLGQGDVVSQLANDESLARTLWEQSDDRIEAGT